MPDAQLTRTRVDAGKICTQAGSVELLTETSSVGSGAFAIPLLPSRDERDPTHLTMPGAKIGV